MSRSFELAAPDHFTAGATGAPGERVFYLQAREGRTLVTLKCEKEHVGGLGEYLAGLLVKLGAGREKAPDDVALIEPLEAAWDVGSLGVGYDEAIDRFLVVAKEATEEEEATEQETEPEAESPESDAATARFLITRAQAAAFAERAKVLIRAGRPRCPMCANPIDPGGHVCPRANGHVVR